MAEPRRLDPCDVLIVGSGASGSMAAMVLAEAGLDVVCLEQGGWTEPHDHPHYSTDWEWQRHNRWNPESNVRKGPDDYPVDTGDEQTLMWNAVGGSTNIYTALWPRYRPSDFRKGIEHGLAPDWPISYEDLAPFYDRCDRLLGTSGLAGDPAMPPRPQPPTPPLPLGKPGRRLAQAFERLGWHWWPIPVAVISEDYDGRKGCNGCGACPMGCPLGAMAKTSLTLWPRALAAGCTLRTFAKVERIEHDKSGRATGAVYLDRVTGARRFQPADVVVLAANGVGSPRLLLLSESARFPQGLANSSDQVGRNLMHHTLVGADMWVEEPLDSHMGMIGALISAEFAETDPSRGFVNGFNFNCVRSFGIGNQTLGFVTGGAAPSGAAHHAWFRKHFDHGVGVFAIGDDLPMPDNRVTLSDRMSDAEGLPAPRLTYAPSENDWRMMRYATERLKDIAGAMGAFEYRINDYVKDGRYHPPAWHLLGTARMGSDPETSVINKWHQAWDVPNLYIIDGGSLPTGGVVNPTNTIFALALRAVEHLRDNFRELRVAGRA